MACTVLTDETQSSVVNDQAASYQSNLNGPSSCELSFNAIAWGNGLSTEDYINSFIAPQDVAFSAKDGRQYEINVVKSKDVTAQEIDACFRLIEAYSRADYENSQIGWNPPHKREEMMEPDMRYLLVRQSDESINISGSNEIVAFLSCMLTVEDNHDVIYVYEVHTSDSTRRTGLGRHLMSMAERIGSKAGMSKAMLTVFTNNVEAEAFYRCRGYIEAKCSPASKTTRSGRVRKPEYYIMEKDIGSSTGVP